MNEVYKKYLLKSKIINIFYIIISLALLIAFYKNPFLQAATIILTFYLHRILTIEISKRCIFPALFQELNAAKFNEVINNKKFISPAPYSIIGTINAGDYQTAVNIANVQLKAKNLSIKSELFYLFFLARAYFELRDFEKLKELCSKYNELKSSYPKKSYFKSNYSMWNYFNSFLKNDFEECKIICNNRNQILKAKHSNYKYNKLQNNFYYAVACYENGETEEARKSFEDIIAFAPNMYLANVSQKYIEGIDSNSQPVFFETKLLPEKDFKLFDDAVLAKMRMYKVIMRILLILYILLVGISFFINNVAPKGNSEILTYETKLNNAISSYYNNAEIVTYFTLRTADNINIDDVCLINDNGNLELVSIITRDKEKSFDLIKLANNITLDVPYCVYSPITDYYIGFQIYTVKSWDTSCYNIVEFEYNGQNCWLCIDYMETVPKTNTAG